jgi:hypothetical protein
MIRLGHLGAIPLEVNVRCNAGMPVRANNRRRRIMRFIVWWILFGAPLVGSTYAWVGLCQHWEAERHRFSKVLANLLATSSSSLACCALAYVQFVRPMPSRNFTVEGWGLLLSFSGLLLSFVTFRSPRWYSNLAFGVSAWMFVLFFLMSSTY